jgi:hypothetical protein
MMMETVLTFYHLPVPLTTLLTLGAVLGLTTRLRAKAEKLMRIAATENSLSQPVSRFRKILGFLIIFPIGLAFPVAFSLFPPILLILVAFLWFAPDYYEKKYERELNVQSRLDAFLPSATIPQFNIRKRVWLMIRKFPIKAGLIAGLIGVGTISGIIKGEKP